MISSEDLSVVVQGPVLKAGDGQVINGLTHDVLLSVRKIYPKAELILSTWAGSKAGALPCDVYVESPDPGGTEINPEELPGRLNNVNRQIVSTNAGLEKTTRRFVLKLRSDLSLLNNHLLANLKNPAGPFADKIGLKGRLVILSFCSLDITKMEPPMLFHFSDLVMAGFREDVRAVWNVALAPEPETSQWFRYRKRNEKAGRCADHRLLKCVPEQYIWSSFLRGKGRNIKIAGVHDIRYPSVMAHLRLWRDAIAVCSPAEIGINMPERFRNTSIDHLLCTPFSSTSGFSIVPISILGLTIIVRHWVRERYKLAGSRREFLPLPILRIARLCRRAVGTMCHRASKR